MEYTCINQSFICEIKVAIGPYFLFFVDLAKLAPLAIPIGIYLAWRAHNRQLKAQRIENTADLLDRFGYKGELADGLIKAAMEVDRDYTKLAILAKDKVSDHYRSIAQYIAELERLAFGLKHNLYDEDYAFKYQGFTFVDSFRYLKPFIEEIQKSEPIYAIELLDLEKRWSKKIVKRKGGL